MRMFYNARVNTFFELLIHTGIEIFQNSNLHFQMPIQVRKKNSNTYIFHVNISSDCVDPIARFKARCFCKSLLINSKTLKESWTLAAARRSPFSSLAGLKIIINKILMCGGHRKEGKVSMCHTSSRAPWSQLYKEIHTF